jgi:hypothetical protein
MFRSYAPDCATISLVTSSSHQRITSNLHLNIGITANDCQTTATLYDSAYGSAWQHCQATAITLPTRKSPQSREKTLHIDLWLSTISYRLSTKTLPPPPRITDSPRHHHRGRLGFCVRQADVPLGQTQFRGNLNRRPVQMQHRATAFPAADFDLLPRHVSDARAEGFGNRLLACQPRRQPMWLVFTIGAFAGREETIEEAFTQPGYAIGHTLIVDHVNPAAEHKTLPI